MTRSRQSALAFGRIAGRVNAEQRRARSALGVAEGAYDRLIDNPSERIEQQDAIRLRRAVRRIESALARARAAVDDAPSDTEPVRVSRNLPTDRTRSRAAPTERVERDRLARATQRRQRASRDEDNSSSGRGNLARQPSARRSPPATSQPSARRAQVRRSRSHRARRSRAHHRSRSAGRRSVRRARVASYRRKRRSHRRRSHSCRRAGRRARIPGRYVVRRGDNLWRIARRHYGRGIKYRRIYRSNRKRIRNPNLIYPCQTFRMPRRR